MSLENEYLFNEASEGLKIGYIHGFTDGKLHGFLLVKIKDIVNNNTTAENVVTNFLKNLKIRWKRASRNRNYFVNRNKDWLTTKVYQSPSDEARAKCRGRPRSESLQESSEKTTRRKTEELANTTPQRLVYAASRVLKKRGQPQLAESFSQFNIESSFLEMKHCH